MTMHPITNLLKRLQDGEALNEAERAALDQWAEAAPENKALVAEISSGLIPVQDILFFKEHEEQLDKSFDKLVTQYMEGSEQIRHLVSPFRKWMRIAAAAAAIMLLAGGAWYFWKPVKVTDHPDDQIAALNIPAGKQGAVLTLSDGSQVVLDSITGGVVAQQGGTSITLQNGLLEYNPEKNAEQPVVFNTMSTPRARQFQMMLPDGTRVWLNAASSIRFPARFTGNSREVAITGEVYFEVAKNDKAPFRVQVSDIATIDVLGTHFNVNAYETTGGISTTLLDGKVKVSGNSIQETMVLKPGQQAILDQQQIRLLKNVNTDQVMAWKNGVFNFEGITLEDFMKEVGRWYDVEVTVSKGVPQIEFQGEMSRDISLKDLMSSLEKFGVRYRMEGKQLIILP